MEKNMVFLKGTKSADVGGGIPWGSLHQDLPSQCVSYSFSRQLVDIFGEAGPRSFRMSDVSIMASPSVLDGLGSGTCVGLHLAGVSPGDCGFVHHIAHLAFNTRHHFAELPPLQW